MGQLPDKCKQAMDDLRQDFKDTGELPKEKEILLNEQDFNLLLSQSEGMYAIQKIEDKSKTSNNGDCLNFIVDGIKVTFKRI